MKKIIFAMIGMSLLFIAACASNETAVGETEDIKDLVHGYSNGAFEDVSASITSDELIVTDVNDEKTTYELPENEFFVSIAPYVETTHPCEIHNLTSCQGELVEEEFDVYIEDTEGNVVMDETVTSMENGFIDLWLPKDETFHVVIEHGEKVAEQEITTFAGDDTCITTMQLV